MKRRSPPVTDRGDAAVGPGDRGLRGPETEQLRHPADDVVAIGELLPDQLLGLALVRGHHRGPGADPGQHRLALGIEDHLDAALAEIADEPGVEVVAGPRRQRAGEHAEPGAAGEVA